MLPAATWGEKTGVFTNADRTVHLSEKAVDPPGEALSDLDIFLRFAREMDFRDRDGRPLVFWRDSESAYRSWQRCSAGRPCDYTSITYDELRAGSGIQWGGARLYADGKFPWAHPDECETYTRDLLTGGEMEPTEYRARNPDGKAMLRTAEHVPPHEPPSEAHPLQLTTGRTIFHFHTRTKTARAPELQPAAPDMWVELSPADAQRPRRSPRATLSTSRRSAERFAPRPASAACVKAPSSCRFTTATGTPQTQAGHDRAANELTLTSWDPVSKQPLFKAGAVSVTKVADGTKPAPAPIQAAARPVVEGQR